MARRVLIDTHVVVDLSTQGGFEAMPARVRRIVGDPAVELLLSVVSEVEIAIKNRIGKLELKKDDLRIVCANAFITSYPLRQQHTDKLFELPLHHRDPFDRMIISTALVDDLPVISSEELFGTYKGLRVIW